MNLRDPTLYRIRRAGITIARATTGASTRCTTSRTRLETPSRASRTRCARSSSRTTARCTTGCSRTSSFAERPRSDRVRPPRSRATPSCRSASCKPAGRGRAIVVGLGRPAHADVLGACGAAASRPRRSARLSSTGSGVTKAGASIGPTSRLLEHAIREHLNRVRTARAWRCCDPLRVVIDELSRRRGRRARRHQQPGGRERRARARCSVLRELYIERDDFMPRTRRRSSSGWPRDARCGYATPTS